jgi:hypothetical protein
MLFCEQPVHSHGLCDKHRKRYERHGSPYVVNPTRSPECPLCLKTARILRRPGNTPSELLEKYTDVYLLHKAGSAYRLKNYDQDGRKYDLEEGLVNAR